MEDLSRTEEMSQQRKREEAFEQEGDSLADWHINEMDREHLRAFPRERKAALMQRILVREPDKSVQLGGARDVGKRLLRLRRDGYALIDLQLHETAFSSVWYRKSDGVLNWRRAEVAMVIWELNDHGPATTVQTWWLLNRALISAAAPSPPQGLKNTGTRADSAT